MNLTCPNCATKFPLGSGMNDVDARKFAAAMGDVPPQMASELLQYLQLFKPAKQGLTWSKALKRITELLPDIRRQKIRYNGRDWAAAPAVWVEAISLMLDRRDTLPMPNHNYLYKIISGLADKKEGLEERKAEAVKRTQAAAMDPSVQKSIKLAEVNHLQRLYKHQPNDALHKQIASLKGE